MRLQKEKTGLDEGIVILVYFALKPLYLSASGTLQISDIILLLGMGVFLYCNKGRLRFPPQGFQLFSLFAVLLSYQFIINLVWSAFLNDISISKHSLYYLFNFFAFFTCLYIGEKIGIDRLKKAVAAGAFYSVIITAVGLLFFQNNSSRSTGFFENPNQLGYYAIIMITVTILCRDQMSKFKMITVVTISIWSIIASLSKAAIIAVFGEILVLILFFQKKKTARRLAIQLILLGVVGLGVYMLFFSESDLILRYPTLAAMRHRILNMSKEGDTNLAYGRGYARVFEMLPHILWGTGEGGYDRFIARHGTEVHSTFISLLTCYGLIGLTGYVYLFYKCMGKGKQLINNAIMMTGLFLYAITHNGIRNTLLWMVLAVMFIENHSYQEQIDNTMTNQQETEAFL